jgi:hypothetical protein
MSYNNTTSLMIVGSTQKFSITKGFGQSIWNLYPVCGCASIRATFWENGTAEHGECLVCQRMSEIMELDEDFEREAPEDQ